jgi:hypothetical protein
MVLDRIRKLHNTMACSGGVISNLRNPSGGRMGEREVEVEEAAHQGEKRRHVANGLCSPPPWGLRLYSRREVALPLPQGT